MKNKTAVQWLQECLLTHLNHDQQMQFEGLFQQSKEMEKTQLEEFYTHGSWAFIDSGHGYTFKEYYEEMFEDKDMVGKYIILNLRDMDVLLKSDGSIAYYDTEEEAREICNLYGIYNAWFCKLTSNHI